MDPHLLWPVYYIILTQVARFIEAQVVTACLCWYLYSTFDEFIWATVFNWNCIIPERNANKLTKVTIVQHLFIHLWQNNLVGNVFPWICFVLVFCNDITIYSWCIKLQNAIKLQKQEFYLVFMLQCVSILCSCAALFRQGVQ